MNILSLFDGQSCLQIALNRLGMKYDKYYASEIDKHAIKITQANYPDTIQLGDVTKWREWDLPKIDILTFGSPCQGFSFAGKRDGFEDPRSALLFHAFDILTFFRPTYFLMENVPMTSWQLNFISDVLQVEPIMINASLSSAQNRKRWYWFGYQPERVATDANLCYTCIHDVYANTRILGETPAEREGAVLGKTQERHSSLCDMRQGVLENSPPRDDQNLLQNLSSRKQKKARQKSRQAKTGRNQCGLPCPTPREAGGIPEAISQNRQEQTGNENTRSEASSQNSQTNAHSLPSGDNGNQKADDERRGISDSQDAQTLRCLQCNREFNHRSYNPALAWREKRFGQSSDNVQALQLAQAEQNDGRVFDIFTIGVKQPKDRGILLKHILEPVVDKKYFLSENALARLNTTTWDQERRRLQDVNEKSDVCLARDYKDGKCVDLTQVEIDNSHGDLREVEKSLTIDANMGTGGGNVPYVNNIRRLTEVEVERLFSIPDNYTNFVASTHRYRCLGNGWEIETICFILSFIGTGELKNFRTQPSLF